MSVTGYHRASIAEREQFLAEIDRLIGSHVLHGSESLCKLLRYLAEHVLHHPGVPVKEYQIATEVFGRPADFDPQSDSTIRVQAGRLRMKLAEYYSSEGADDPIVVELPKGTYVLSFHQRAHAPVRERCWQCMILIAFSHRCIGRFGSSAGACSRWMMPRTTI